MNVFQIILNDYDSDDGHYTSQPYDESVFADEAVAVARRDELNEVSVKEHNEYTEKLIKEHKSKGWKINSRHYGLFTGDPKDIEQVERFANRDNCLAYYTIETLEVI